MLIGAAFAVGISGYIGFFSDNLYVNGIPPWDASFYAKMVRDFYGSLGEVGPYAIQRILPSAIIHHVFLLLSIPPTDSNIIQGFVVLNALLITLIGYLFSRTADELRLSTRSKWLGFIGLFINFAVLKHRFYDPMLTDTSAFAVGMLLLYFYLKGNLLGLYIATALGAFVWPTIFVQGALLLAFPRQESENTVFHQPLYLKKAALIISLLISLMLFLFIMYLRRIGFSTVMPAFRPAINLSIAVALLYIFYGLKTLFSTGELLNVNHLRSALLTRWAGLRLGSVILLGILVKLLQRFLASSEGPDYSLMLYAQTTLWVSIIYPAVFYISHVVYFGPMVILLLFLWKEVCSLIHQHGIGLSLCAALCFILSLNGESRQFINFLPVFVIFLAKATDSLRWGRRQYWLLASISILMSKVWLTIGPLKTQGMSIADIIRSNQLLFMNNGPAMTGQMYVVQGCMVLLLIWIVYYFCFRKQRTNEFKQQENV